MRDRDRDGRIVGNWDRPLPAAVFKYADSATLAEAPPRCPRCGGLWRPVSEGYQCRQCPRRWLASERLTELVGRTLEHAAWAHVPRTQTGPRGLS